MERLQWWRHRAWWSASYLPCFVAAFRRRWPAFSLTVAGIIGMFDHEDKLLNQKLDTIISLLHNILDKEKQMALDVTALQTAVANETTVEASAVTLIQGFAGQIQALIAASANTVDPAALQALVDKMTASQTALAAAVAANTVAAPPTPAP